jgi:hypothetical protein
MHPNLGIYSFFFSGLPPSNLDRAYRYLSFFGEIFFDPSIFYIHDISDIRKADSSQFPQHIICCNIGSLLLLRHQFLQVFLTLDIA